MDTVLGRMEETHFWCEVCNELHPQSELGGEFKGKPICKAMAALAEEELKVEEGLGWLAKVDATVAATGR